MFTIGQFARIGKISTKTLRYYDEIGLLPPAYVDKENQYRYYSSEQVTDIIFIRKLKQYGFGLDEICLILSKRDTNALRVALEQKLDSLENEVVRLNKMKTMLTKIIIQLKGGAQFTEIANQLQVDFNES